MQRKNKFLMWSKRQQNALTKQLENIIMQEWGGPRSPIAISYLKETVIPDLVYCFRVNADLLSNPSFEEIVAWKLKTQYAYPRAAADDLSRDLLQPALKLAKKDQNLDLKEPWRRVFRLWIGGESLPNIADKTGFPLDFLDLLLLRLKKVKNYLEQTKNGLWECLQHPELRQMGVEQLTFFYQLVTNLENEPLYKERLILEQVIFEMGLPLEAVDLVSLLEVIYRHDSQLEEKQLMAVMGRTGGLLSEGAPIAQVLEGLIALQFVQKNKSGGFSLTEKGIHILSGFLLPKLTTQLTAVMDSHHWERAEQIMFGQNPEILVDLLTWAAKNRPSHQAFRLCTLVYKKVNRRVDIYVLEICRRFSEAFSFLLSSLKDSDSLLRAKASESLAHVGNKEASFGLIQLLKDPVPVVRARAAFALGELGSPAGIKELTRVAEDYAEENTIRQHAQEALRKISGKK